jgi:hypothetical protein
LRSIEASSSKTRHFRSALVAHLVPDRTARDEAGRDEPLQLASCRTERNAGAALDLAQMEVLGWPEQKQGEQAQVIVAEQQSHRRSLRWRHFFRTHGEHDCAL